MATGTETELSACLDEAARLVSDFLGDLCVIAPASGDRRRSGPFTVHARDPERGQVIATALRDADSEGRAWPLAGRALTTGRPVVVGGIRPGELDGILNPAMGDYLERFGLSTVAFLPMRAQDATTGVLGMGRGPGRPSYTDDELEAAQLIADAAAEGGEGLLARVLAARPREAEQQFRALVERLPAVVYEAEAGPGGRWHYVSAFIETLLGYRAQEWLDDPGLWAARLHDEDREAVLAAEDRLAGGERSSLEYRMVARDGSVVWVRDDAVPREPRAGARVLDGLLTDITDRKAAEARLQHLADHDALTGLLNRRRFLEELEQELAAMRRGMRSSSAVLIDVDGFKYVNDSLGHQAGDELIRAVARALDERLRASDTVARLGGDEFACLLRGAGIGEAETVAAQLLEGLRDRRFTAGGEPVRVTASGGVTELRDGDAETAEAVLSAADLAMYEAKRAGRDRVVRFTPELRAELERGRSWVTRLHDALEHDGFELFAQPVMDLATREIAQYELLLRLRDGEGELAGPDVFLPVAERFDLTEAIDRWVLRRAMALLREPGSEACLAVNLSGRSIGAEVVLLLERELGRGGVDAGRLVVEVTETAAIADIGEARMFTEALARIGVRVALDDFGAGLGLFSHLKQLPVDYLKIDGEFIGGLASSPVDQEMVKAIVMLARAVGRRTIAEFVPDAETLELLAQYGVDLAQGFHVGHPRPIEEGL